MIEGKLDGKNHTCGIVAGSLNRGETRSIACARSAYGDIVKIRMTGTEKGPLTLCEVEVFGIRSKSNSTGRC